MVLLLYAIIHCFAAYIRTVSVSLILAPFNILMKCFYTCFTGFSLYVDSVTCQASAHMFLTQAQLSNSA